MIERVDLSAGMGRNGFKGRRQQGGEEKNPVIKGRGESTILSDGRAEGLHGRRSGHSWWRRTHLTGLLGAGHLSLIHATGISRLNIWRRRNKDVRKAFKERVRREGEAGTRQLTLDIEVGVVVPLYSIPI